MKTNRKLMVIRLVALGVLVAGFSAKPASAQILREPVNPNSYPTAAKNT
jgi:hypothetical protein